MRRLRRGERRDDGDRDTGRAAGSVDREVGRVLQTRDTGAVLSPVGKALLPEACLVGRVLVQRAAGAPAILLVDPRREVLGGQIGKRQQQIADVTLGIDDEGGNAVDRGFFDERQTQAGLAAAGHADAHRVRDQILGVVQQEIVTRSCLP